MLQTRGMSTFTFLHVVLSLVGIVSGFVVMFGLLTLKPLPGWTAAFLSTTLATSVTGFGFPFTRFLPSHAVGVLSIVVLGLAIGAYYGFRHSPRARALYVVSAVLALYFNVFVLVVQAFLKVPVLHALAPTQAELPFAAAQGLVLAGFVALAIGALRQLRIKGAPAQPAA